jgi:hypothetical protein
MAGFRSQHRLIRLLSVLDTSWRGEFGAKLPEKL